MEAKRFHRGAIIAVLKEAEAGAIRPWFSYQFAGAR